MLKGTWECTGVPFIIASWGSRSTLDAINIYELRTLPSSPDLPGEVWRNIDIASQLFSKRQLSGLAEMKALKATGEVLMQVLDQWWRCRVSSARLPI